MRPGPTLTAAILPHSLFFSRYTRVTLLLLLTRLRGAFHSTCLARSAAYAVTEPLADGQLPKKKKGWRRVRIRRRKPATIVEAGEHKETPAHATERHLGREGAQASDAPGRPSFSSLLLLLPHSHSSHTGSFQGSNVAGSVVGTEFLDADEEFAVHAQPRL